MKGLMTETAFLALLISASILSGGSPALAQDKTPVGVVVSFEMPLLVHNWSQEQVAEAKSEAERGISQILQRTFSYWDFRPGDKAAPFLLRLCIRDPDPQDHRQRADLFLETYINGREDQAWSHPWLDPTDFDYLIYPDAAQMPQALARLFTRFFIENTRVDFGKWLKASVPVAKTGEWLPAAGESSLQIILAIPFETFNTLGYSVFVIKARSPGHLPRTLEAQGIGIGLPYPPRSRPPLFLGLAVQPLETGAGEQRPAPPDLLQGFRLGPVFLKREELYDYDY